MNKRSNAPDEPSFSEAMEEIESALRRIEGDQVDIDLLGRELGRAAELLEICRRKIRRAEVEVKQIVEAIEEDAANTGEAAAAPREDFDLDDLEAPAGAPDDDIPF